MKETMPKTSVGTLCGLFGKTRQAYYKFLRYEYRTLAEKQLVLEMVRNERAILPGVGVRKLHSIIFGPSRPQ